MGRIRAGLLGGLVLAGLMSVVPVTAVTAAPEKAAGDDVVAHWTAARRKAAIPRDLRVDDRGLAYLVNADGTLAPHGHAVRQLHASGRASNPTAGKPPSSGDNTGPSVTNQVPIAGATIGASHTFSATVTDPSGVRSVTFTIVYPSGTTQSFAAAASGSTYSATISGFTDGAWGWRVTAKDNAGKRGNTTTTATTPFTVTTDGGGGGGGTVVNAPWTGGGTVQNAAGRIYFQMPANSQQTSWTAYVCSGSVAQDATSGRSVIITAAHCVYDDVHKAFARNVLFIPNQDGTTGTGTDTNCANDPMGCWTPSFGVVDDDWASRTFPANIPWDYAFYVVPDAGAHSGTAASSDVLDVAAGNLSVQLTAPTVGAVAHALGYSYSDDPNFMYCAEPLASESGYDDWWLGQCDLSGGSSGGPWLQPVNGGNGPIISVNSWGYTNQPGMGGPRLAGTSASCVFGVAKSQTFPVSDRGVTPACPTP
jgi:hypothetical protein